MSPYIKPEDRPDLAFLEKRGPVGYAEMSAVRGVLADVSSEFYRRKMAPYEDMKREENGDVY